MPAEDVDDYLAALPDDSRAALESLRATVKAAAPEAVETISYRIPTFKYRGSLVAYAAFKNHCSFFVMSPSVMAVHEEELKHYDTSTGTIRFPANKPLPAALVKKIVAARIAENEAAKKKK